MSDKVRRPRSRGIDAIVKDLDLEFEGGKVPEWFLGTFVYVLFSLHLPNIQRDGRMVLEYFMDNVTLKDLGVKYSITSECVRQQIQRCMLKLRHPERRRMLTMGVSAYYTEKMQDTATKAYDDGYRAGVLSATKDTSLVEETRSQLLSELYEKKIWEIDISTRLRMCLGKMGYSTVGEVIKAGSGKIYNIRCLGDKTYAELVTLLVKDFGEKVENWVPPK